MKDLFTKYELAKLLKEKGFKETCFGLYDNIKALHTNEKYVFVEDELNIVAPLYQQVTDWLSEKHQIFIDIGTDCTTYPKFDYSINKFVGNPKDLAEKEWYWENPKPSNWFLYRTRNEALEEAIKFALTLI